MADNPIRKLCRRHKLRKLIKFVQTYTMLDPLRLYMLYGLAQEAVSKNEGDIVERGVCNGGSAAILAAAIRDIPQSKLWLYDTFEGMPAPGPEDGVHAQEFTGKLKGSEETVRRLLHDVNFPSERVIIRKGDFQNTFSEAKPDKVILLHIDADWYDSVKLSLDTFYEAVSQNGVVVLDDFGHWEGAREAFYDFCERRHIRPLLERVGDTQAFWKKEVKHNRESYKNFRSGMYRPGSTGEAI